MARTTDTAEKLVSNGASAVLIQFDMLNELFKIAVDGAHAMATRQSQAISDFHRHFADLTSQGARPSALPDGAAPGMAFTQEAFVAGLSHGMALAEIAVKMEFETLAILNRSLSVGLNGPLQSLFPIKGS